MEYPLEEEVPLRLIEPLHLPKAEGVGLVLKGIAQRCAPLCAGRRAGDQNSAFARRGAIGRVVPVLGLRIHQDYDCGWPLGPCLLPDLSPEQFFIELRSPGKMDSLRGGRLERARLLMLAINEESHKPHSSCGGQLALGHVRYLLEDDLKDFDGWDPPPGRGRDRRGRRGRNTRDRVRLGSRSRLSGHLGPVSTLTPFFSSPRHLSSSIAHCRKFARLF